MNKQNSNPEDAANLRQKAERHLNQRKSESNKFASETEMMRLIHELEVHQVELELQNEELILANNMAREATEKFEELYDFAPSGYFTLSRQGKILEMNLRSAQILGKERNLLINSQFGLFIKEDSRTVFSNFLEKIFQGNSHVKCDVPLLSINNNNLHVHLTGIMSDKKDQCRITAIDITERKNNEKELLISKEKSERNEIELKKVQEITHVGSWHLNLETNEVVWTEELYKMYGFNPALPPPPYTEHKKLFTTESWEILSASLAKTSETGIPYELELKTIRKDKSNGWLWVRGEAIFDNSNKIIGLWGAAQDITERKHNEEQWRHAKEKAEESDEKYRALFDNAPLSYQSLDENGCFIDVNPKWLKTLGFERSEVIGKWFGDFLHPDFAKHFRISFPAFKERGYVSDVQYKLRRKDNTYIDVSFEGYIGNTPEGKFKQTYCVFKDVTEQIVLENELAESAERYKSLHNASFGGIAIHDKGIILECNQGLSEMTGYAMEELIGMDGLLLIAPIHREMVMNKIVTGYEKPYEANGLRKTGEQFPMRLEARNVPYKGKNVRTVEFRDITESKKAEEALRRSEDRFNLAMKASNDGLFDWNLETNDIYYSPGWKKMLGYEDHELPNDFSVWEKASDPDDAKKSWELQRKLITKQIDRFVLEFKMKHKEGHWVDILSRAEAIFNDSGKAIRIVGTHTDITERKQAEMIAIKERAISDIIIDSTPGAFYMLDENGRYVRWNAYQRDVIIGKPESMVPGTNAIETIHPEDRDLIGSKIVNVLKNGDAETVEGRVLLHGGPEFRWLILTGRRIVIEGKPYLLGIGMDITERKLLENALRENEERLRLALKATSDVVWDWDIVNDSQCWNEAGKIVFGWTEIVENTVNAAWWMKRIHPDDRKRVEVGFYEAVQKQTVFHWQDEYRFRKSDGTYAEVIDRANVLRDNTGKPIRMIGAMLDITERRRIEKQIKENEHRFRTVANFTYNMEYWQLPNGQLNYISPSCERITGYSKLEFISNPDLLLKIVHPDDIAIFMGHSNLEKTHKSDFPEKEINFRIIKKDSSIVWIEHVCRAVFDDNNNYLGRRVSHRDITPRVLAEESLRSSEEKYRLLAENSADVIWKTDSKGCYTYLSRSVKKVYGYEPEEALGLSMMLSVPPEQREKTVESFQETIRYIQSVGADIQPFMIDLEQVRKDGSKLWVETIFKAMFDENNQFNGFLGITRDITERKKASFEAQRYANEQILMAKIAHELVGMESKEQMYHYIAEQAYNLCSESYLILGYYDEEKDALMLKSTFGLKKQIEGLKKFFVINPYKMSINLKDFPEEELKMIKNRKLNFFKKDGIHKISGGLLSKKLGKMVEEFLGVKNTYLMGISWNEKNYGVIGIISRSKLPLKNMVLIETIVNQSAIAVQRLFTSEELKRSESRYRTLVEMSPDGIGLFKPEGKLLSCNLQMARLLGYSDEADLLSREFNASDLITEDDRKRVSQNLKLLLTGKSVPLQTYTLRRKDGSVFPAEVNSVTVRDEVGNSLRLLSIVRDVTDRIKGEEALARYNEQLRNFAGHNEMVREQERLNLARDIHDVLGSSLAGLKMELVILKRLLSDDLLKSKPDISKQINSMSIQINESVEVMRKIVRELRPGILDELGLIEAIKWYAGEIANRGNFFCKIKIAGKLINFDKTQSVIIFRIYQEIMTNIVLHSKATKVTIQIDLNDNILQLSVNDNGIGINEDAAARTDSFGLIGMKERALLMDGKLSIHGSRNKGTTVMLEVPVNI